MTVPSPEPDFTSRISNGPAEVNVAMTAWYWLIVTVHVLAVPHDPTPVHPVNVELVAALEVRTITVPEENDDVTEAPFAQPLVYAQLTEAAVLITVPRPLPNRRTDRTGLNLAVTVRAASITTEHEGELLAHPSPPHPANAVVLAAG